MIQCQALDLPPHAQITLNDLDEPPHVGRCVVLRVELPYAVRIDATWEHDSGGYWITASRAREDGIEEFARQWSGDKESLVSAVELLVWHLI